ncbi:MAG: hypothetical protein JXN59_06145 [Anaerolineae bacterium]|nr:hypothetical protein [Anaerolineae bacterium]
MGMKHSILALLMVCVGLLLTGARATAQDARPAPVDVFVIRNAPDAPADTARLFFMNALTGDTVAADLRGDRFMVVDGYVLYEDPDSGTIFRAWPDGRIEQHPFIQPGPETRRIDWVVTPDHAWIAWMVTDAVNGGLRSVTTLARADGSEPRVILTEGPDAFMQAVPIALTDDWTFYFDRQPQGVTDFFFYRQYASIYRLEAGKEAPRPELLPFEPNCFCGAGLSSNGQYFARLEQVSEAGGFDVRLWNLAAGVDTFAPSLNVNYEAAGGVLVSDDGRRVVYSLANNLALDSANSGRERYMLTLMDAATGQQRQLVYNQLLVPLLPLAWTEDGSGVILVHPRQDGTWKLNLQSGEIGQVSAGTWVGTIR